MTEDKKTWQHGFDLEYLKEIEAEYKEYNSYSVSPFSAYKKNNIAQDLHDGVFVTQWNGNGTSRMTVRDVKVKTAINMLPELPICCKEPTDVVFTHVIGDPDFATFSRHNCWVYVWAADKRMQRILEAQNFRYVGGKISTYGECTSIYFRDEEMAWGDRVLTKIDPVNFANLLHMQNVGVGQYLIDLIAGTLQELDISFTNHYSNYNAKNSWSALSLRGYSADPTFIAKPIEMSKKWKEEHKDETYFLQDTELYEKFPLVRQLLLALFEDAEIHRVRFMKLAPGGGELQRHTDQVDPEAGNNIGQVARFHFPIVTNDKVEFTVWNVQDIPTTVNMKTGQCWLLDTRFPHRVVNGGDTPRIHLVVDVKVNKMVKEMILQWI